jgi:hypothetical protein
MGTETGEHNLKYQLDILRDYAKECGLEQATQYLDAHPDKSGSPLHMWEAEHNYYMTDHSYWGHDTITYYKSWKAFLESEEDSDPDYNLIFRWDWKPTVADDQYGEVQMKLHFYWATQRKGYFRTTITDVNKQDEPMVRAWLHPRFEHLLRLWEPFVWVDDRVPDHNVREVITEDPKERMGACECCEYPNAKVRPYPDQRDRTEYKMARPTGRIIDEGSANIWLCHLCAHSWTGNSIQYPEQYEYGKTMQVVCKTANAVMDKFDEVENFDRAKLTGWMKAKLFEMFKWQEEEE